ncbi:MAG: RNA polymerase nonessential primary-like sigma factor [Phormidesmis priestleyi Ana]|uniref:RNA polymerase nonessential primary-like sigma factor n=1 Tax=Phormidesmis priestleyi Ana TaxID=1666911 RepID=A0A0P8BLE2_9CYAN|nr:MAG: RNA polymerase nonessential primary-like sigma factor [Phormidesmis priestleyi Ana]
MPLTQDYMKTTAQSSNLVRSYLKNIGRYPLLTHEQEIVLGKKVQQYMKLEAIRSALVESMSSSTSESEDDSKADFGDSEIICKTVVEPTREQWAKEAALSVTELNQALEGGKRSRAKMVRCNLRLVVSVAKKYSGQSLEMMDLIQEGTIGLHRGVEKFDPSKGYRFSTYAYWWIRQAITRSISNNSRIIRLPIHVGDQLRKIRKVQRQLALSLGRAATVKEVAQELSMPVEKLRELQMQGRHPLSLDMKVGSEQNTELGALLEDEGILPEDYATQSLLKRDLAQLLSATLSDQQKAIVKMRYGLETGSKMTLSQISERMGISRERVRQVERSALRRLRQQGASLREYTAAVG